MWNAFRDIYLRTDRRVLGVFRILFGLVLLYDVLRRFPDAGLLWSSDGVLSGEALRGRPEGAGQYSLLLFLSSTRSVQLAFAGMLGVFSLYTAGLYTRLMQPLALLLYASLNARNLCFEDGGTGLTIVLLTWTLLLPLGDRFSLDAIRRDAACTNLKGRVAERARRSEPLFSLAMLALLLEAAVIYWLNAVHKTGHTWRGGDAVHLVLWQHRVNTPFALWLAAHEPAWLSPILTWSTKRLEFVMPILLLWPSHPRVTRPAAFLFAIMLHGGIALTLTLGPFSYSMICLLWLCVPGGTLNELGRAMPQRHWWALARRRARWVAGWRRRLPVGPRLSLGALGQYWPRIREGLLVVILFVETCSILSENRAIPVALRPPKRHWMQLYKPYLRGFQGWSMFAPNAPEEDGTMVVDGVTKSGRHVDPFTGEKPDFEGVRRGLVPHRIALSDYLFMMQGRGNAVMRSELKRWERSYSPHDPLVSAEHWWVSYVPPPRGSYEPGPIRKKRLWKTKF